MRRYTNTAAETALSADALAADTTLVVGTTLGWIDPGAGNVAVAVLAYDDPNFIEVVTYSGLTPTSLTGVVRGLDGTLANPHPAGTVVQHAASAQDIERALGVIDQVTTAGDLLVGSDVGAVVRLPKGANGTVLSVDDTTGELTYGSRVTTAELEAHVTQEVSQSRDAIEAAQTDADAEHKIAPDAHHAYAYTINQAVLNGPLDRPRPTEAQLPNGQAFFSIRNAPPGVNERKRVRSTNATGGTFTLNLDGQTTAAIAYNATASAVQLALESISTIGAGNVTCSGGPVNSTEGVLVDFVGAKAATDISALTPDGSSLAGTGAAVTADTIYHGVNFGMLSEDKLFKMEPTANWTPS